MGIATNPLKVQFFIAVLFQSDQNIEDVLFPLTKTYGPIDSSYGPIPFGFSDYYKEEMGEGLLKSYHTFGPLMDRDMLPEVKNFTNELEGKTKSGDNRRVNLDPGYIARDKLVLVTTKDFYHRLYLGNGIYGEVTLHFRKGVFRYFSWTYPDYKDEQFLEYLTKARAKFMHELREGELPNEERNQNP
jgi:hypothetical protein